MLAKEDFCVESVRLFGSELGGNSLGRALMECVRFVRHNMSSIFVTGEKLLVLSFSFYLVHSISERILTGTKQDQAVNSKKCTMVCQPENYEN